MAQELAGAALAGFLLGASLIIAIGAQNAFVLKLGILRTHVFPVVTICALSDAILIVAGVGGFGTFVQSSPNLIFAVTVFGAVFLLVYGLLAFRRAFTKQSLRPDQTFSAKNVSFTSTVVTTLSLTFLNPHVYLDTVVLLGGLSAAYEGFSRLAYGIGAVVASFAWFFVLGYGARLLVPVFEKPISWRVLEFSIGVVMWSIAAKLLYGYF